MTSQDHRLFLFATIRPKPEYFQQARTALDNIVPLTLEEPGCHVFSAFVGQEEPNTLHLFECFENEAALQEHYATPYTAAMFEQYRTWLAAPVEIRKLSRSVAASSIQFA
jgi:quinol monooxygenase YgiN